MRERAAPCMAPAASRGWYLQYLPAPSCTHSLHGAPAFVIGGHVAVGADANGGAVEAGVLRPRVALPLARPLAPRPPRPLPRPPLPGGVRGKPCGRRSAPPVVPAARLSVDEAPTPESGSCRPRHHAASCSNVPTPPSSGANAPPCAWAAAQSGAAACISGATVAAAAASVSIDVPASTSSSTSSVCISLAPVASSRALCSLEVRGSGFPLRPIYRVPPPPPALSLPC